jgi:hypothetical protein
MQTLENAVCRRRPLEGDNRYKACISLRFGGGQVEIHLAAVWRSSAGELTAGVMGRRSWDATTKAGALAAVPGVWRMVLT